MSGGTLSGTGARGGGSPGLHKPKARKDGETPRVARQRLVLDSRGAARPRNGGALPRQKNMLAEGSCAGRPQAARPARRIVTAWPKPERGSGRSAPRAWSRRDAPCSSGKNRPRELHQTGRASARMYVARAGQGADDGQDRRLAAGDPVHGRQRQSLHAGFSGDVHSGAAVPDRFRDPFPVRCKPPCGPAWRT